MPIVPNRIYTTSDLDAMFRACEFRPTDYHSEQEAHGFSRHIGITNAEMMARAAESMARPSRRNDDRIVAITAFADNASACLAGAMLLNSAVGQAALNDLAAGHTGMRAAITWLVPRPVPIRYVTASNQAVKTMPCHWFKMLVDRSEIRPLGIHLHTMFGLLKPNARNEAIIWDRNGVEIRRYP